MNGEMTNARSKFFVDGVDSRSRVKPSPLGYWYALAVSAFARGRKTLNALCGIRGTCSACMLKLFNIMLYDSLACKTYVSTLESSSNVLNNAGL